MNYGNWKITVYPSFLGYFAQYLSPTGQAHYTSAYFATEQQALSFAQSRVDQLLECERLRFEPITVGKTNCAV
jgi:hypothetical protein